MISPRPADQCRRTVHSMLRSMEQESFYISGTYEAPEFGIYSGWVGQEGSWTAAQPCLHERPEVALLFSGECFLGSGTALRRLRRNPELTEESGRWLVHLYEEDEEKFFAGLNGLFSGLLIDRRKQAAFLFNDRYGFDRIYVHQADDTTYFASEAKALLEVLPAQRILDPESLAQYLAVGCTVDDRTLYRGIRLLPGGSNWQFHHGKCRQTRYFTPATWESLPAISEQEFLGQFRESLRRIIPRYFRGPESIGISLTAGLDTRMLLAGRPTGLGKIPCYTFDAEKGSTLDSRLARRVAERCGLGHELVRLGADFFSNFADHVDRTVYLSDGCFGVLGAHEVYFNRQARKVAPVRLTGVFGGEVLREVSTFKPIGLAPELFDPDLGQAVNSYVREFTRSRGHPVTFAAFREVPYSIAGSLAACRSQITFRTPYLDTELMKLAYQTPQELRGSANPAIGFIRESDPGLGRIPTDMALLGCGNFLNRRLRNFFSKATFKLDYWCNDGMPNWLAAADPLIDKLNQKVGVPGLHKYLRYRRWFRSELSGYLREAFDHAQVAQNSLWNRSYVKQLAERHIAGRFNGVREINAVLTLGAVQRLLLKNS